MEKEKLLRSENKKLCGVCAGIAEYFDLDPTIIRVAAAVITLCSLGFGVLLYLAAALVIPSK